MAELKRSDLSFRADIPSNLKYFSESKPGKLTSDPLEIYTETTPEDCATHCLQYSSKCVSFDYDHHTKTCELQGHIEGPEVTLATSGDFVNYERFGTGGGNFISFLRLPLEHGTTYYINALVTNALNYTGVMHSRGTMVDWSSPEPGYLGAFYTEEFRADGCNASKMQDGRCISVTLMTNHR